MDTGSKVVTGMLLFVAAAVLLLVAVLRLRQARQALQEARSSLTARNQFLGMMAHEMLTPLQTIISSVELIELGGRMPSDDQTFRRLRRSAQQLEAQMNDTVEFARLSGGRLKVSPMLFQPDLMMQIIVAEYEEAARERGVQLKVRIDPQPCPRVITDPARLRQIVANLISNATKYASPGEVLCSVRVQRTTQQVTVAVIDQGPGFDPALDIWEPFVRGSQAQTGSGLGLAVVKLMADLLGGSARVVSKSGEGSAFIVQVPVEVEVVAGEVPPPSELGQMRILVVEDNEDVRVSLHAMLQAFGVQVDLAESVRSAAARLAGIRYDGVLLDLRLPDGSGYDVAAQARQAGSANESTPLVALSAYHESDAQGDTLFAAKFEKPITAARLRTALQLFG
jgi:two-component system capsular synthesis sensor histidine kinase RcsC